MSLSNIAFDFASEYLNYVSKLPAHLLQQVSVIYELF
jgi:hypothetical protein